MKEVLSIRIDPDLKKKAKRSGLDLGAIIEAALAKFLKEKKCPYCGVSVKVGKKQKAVFDRTIFAQPVKKAG